MDNLKKEDSIILNSFFDFFLKERVDIFNKEIERSRYFSDGNCEFEPIFAQVDLLFSPICNQKCEYCYLYKYGDELYPYKGSKEELLKNLDLILDYIYNNKKMFPYTFELFGGDLFIDDIFFDIINIFEKYFKSILKKYPELFFNNNKNIPYEQQVTIIVPSNLSFVYNSPEKGNKVTNLLKRLEKEYNVRISFSWSTDGLYCTDSREKKELNQEYFDTILSFCIKNQVGVHPMVAPENIKNWIKNYDWWLEFQEELNRKTNHEGDFQPFLLEVRNGYWSDENIEDYKKLLTHIIEVRYEKVGKDINKLAYHLFHQGEINDKNPILLNSHDIASFDFCTPGRGQENIGCSMPHTFTINLNDLTLPICHRLTYQHLVGGYFILNEEKNKIIGIEAKNPTVYITAKTINQLSIPKCATCNLKEVCMKQCFGSQFEQYGELFLPIENICKLLKSKYYHLMYLYDKYGVIDCAIQNNYIDKEYADYLIKLREEVKNEYK